MTSRQTEKIVNAILDQLTIEECVDLCHAASHFTAGGIPRLNVPAMTLSDGPHGVRIDLNEDWTSVYADDDPRGQATYLPVLIALSATWNTQRAKDFGDVLGAEARARGKDVILGPGVNLIRTPLCGRNFEYFGEDPQQTGDMASAVIAAIQHHDVAACVKHFAVNNQELNRFHVNIEVDEQTLRELYLPAFEQAVRDAHCLTVMGAYNKLRGHYCCHNHYLLTTILKKEWGFKGQVISDWGGTHDTAEAVNNGLDLEMGGDPKALFLDRPYRKGLADGTYDSETARDKARRHLHVLASINALPGQPKRSPGERLSDRHHTISRRIAEESIVLLRNENNSLPISPLKKQKIVVVGDNAVVKHATGGGSSAVNPPNEVTPLAGIKRVFGEHAEISYVAGYPVAVDGVTAIPTECLSISDTAGIRGWRQITRAGRSEHGDILSTTTVAQPTLAANAEPVAGYPAGTWTATWQTTVTPQHSGRYQFVLSGGDSLTLRCHSPALPDGGFERVIWDLTAATTEIFELDLLAGAEYVVEIMHMPRSLAMGLSFGWITPDAHNAQNPSDATTNPYAEAVHAAAGADVVIVCGGLNHRYDAEGGDRSDLSLPGGQDGLITALAAVHDNIVVVLYAGAAVAMPWLDQVAAVLMAWYPGQAGGDAVADIISGAVNPSGRLPFSWPKQLSDVAAHTYAEKNNDAYAAAESHYHEGQRIGYRWHNHDGPAALYPFGFGLSYTRFSLTNAQLIQSTNGNWQVTIVVRNTGNRPGATVAQCYLDLRQTDAAHAIRRLVAFEKITLQPQEVNTLTLVINERQRSFWNLKTQTWQVAHGTFGISVGEHADHPAASFSVDA